MTDNTFPLYEVDAIVTFFRTEVLTDQEAKHFSRNDLTPSPNPDSIQRLYTRLLQLLYRFKPECHYMVPMSVNIQNPAFYEGPAAIMSIYLRMSQFLPTCLVYDFSLSDLLAPKLKRTIMVLSGIMNFLHFRNKRSEMVMNQQERFRAAMDKKEVHTRGIKDAEKKIEKLTTIPPEQQAEFKELAIALSDLSDATKQEMQESNGLKEQVAEWKTENAKRSQKLTQIKMDVTTLQDTIGQLKSQIVESPEELKTQMEKMKETVKNIKLSIEEADLRLVEHQTTVQGVTHDKAEIQHMYKLLQDLQGSLNKTREHQQEVQELEAHYEKQQKELKNHSTEEAQLKRILAMKMDKDIKQQMRRQMKKDSKDQNVDDVMGHCNQLNQKRNEVADKIQEITTETEGIRSKTQNLRDVCNKETERSQALLDILLGALDQFHKKLENQIVE